MLLNEKINDLQNLTQQKISYEQVAQVLGLGSKQAAYNRVTRKQELKEWEILALDNAFLHTKLINTNQETTEDGDDRVLIDYYPDVFGSCGSGTFALSQCKELIPVSKKLFSGFSSTKKYSVINAVGDSMFPTIIDKDKLIVEHQEGERLKDNRIYVFCYCDEIFVKRLIKNIDEIIVKSDNPDPIYRPRYIAKDDFKNLTIIGEIVGLLKKFNN